MNEQSKTTIERARALLAEVTQGQWTLNGDASPHGHLEVSAVGGAPVAAVWGGRENQRGVANAAFIAAAPTLIATLIDEADASERRAVEVEAGAAAMRETLRDYLVCSRCDGSRGHSDFDRGVWQPCSHCGGVGEEPRVHMALASGAGRAYSGRLERAEAIAVSKTHEVSAILADARDTQDGLFRQFDDLRRRSRDEARVALMRIGELEAEHNANRTAAENAYAAQIAAESELDALRAELEKERAKVRRLENRPELPKGGCSLCDGLGFFPAGARSSEAEECHKCGGSGAVIVEGEP